MRAIARPSLGPTLMAFVSYSAETVTSDLGLHSRWLRMATVPLSENLVFTKVFGSTLWILPMLKLLSKLDNLCIISAATSVPVTGFMVWIYEAFKVCPLSVLYVNQTWFQYRYSKNPTSGVQSVTWIISRLVWEQILSLIYEMVFIKIIFPYN